MEWPHDPLLPSRAKPQHRYKKYKKRGKDQGEHQGQNSWRRSSMVEQISTLQPMEDMYS